MVTEVYTDKTYEGLKLKSTASKQVKQINSLRIRRVVSPVYSPPRNTVTLRTDTKSCVILICIYTQYHTRML
jgi:hypothetical protein